MTLCSKLQIDGEDFVNFCGLLRKHENAATTPPNKSVHDPEAKEVPTHKII